MFKKLSSGNSPSMERVRKEYINSDVLVSAKDKGNMLDLTIITEKIIWLLRGASSKRNIQLAKEKNMEVIHTLCPLLFIYEKGFHRFHYNILRFFHLFPKSYSKN